MIKSIHNVLVRNFYKNSGYVTVIERGDYDFINPSTSYFYNTYGNCTLDVVIYSQKILTNNPNE